MKATSLTSNKVEGNPAIRFTVKKRKIIVDVLSLFLFIVLIYAGVTKLVHYNTTLNEWSISKQFRRFAHFNSIILPITEIGISISLFAQRSRFYGLIMAILLFAVYIIAMFTLKLYVPNIRGGMFNYGTFNQYLILNGSLLFIALLAFFILVYSWRSN
jgi:hypothetical protein